MKQPVICHLSDFGAEYPGSFIDSIVSLSRSCRERLGIETFCVFPERGRCRAWVASLRQEGIQCAFVPRSRNIVLPLARALKSCRPVIFHSHFDTFDLSAVAMKALLYRGSKVVWHFHSVASLTKHQRIKDAFKVRTIARTFVDAFIPVADGAYRNSLERGYPRERVMLNYNGVNVRRFASDISKRPELRRAFGAFPDDFVFLCLGYSPVIKGADLFVKAAEAMQEAAGKRSVFIVIGRGETREFISRLPESARLGAALKVSDPVDDFSQLLRRVDVLVAPSRTEGLSYAVLEAMCAGKLVISSDIPGVRETYGSLDGLWLFPSEDWQKLSELMAAAKQLSLKERQSLGRANSAHIAANYSLDRWTEKTVSLYATLLHKSTACETPAFDSFKN